MFPRQLAESVFSMQPEKVGCALSVSVVLDAEGGIAASDATTSLVFPQRLTYDALNERLAAGDSHVDADLHALLAVGRTNCTGDCY